MIIVESRNELIALAKYWYEYALEAEYRAIVLGQAGDIYRKYQILNAIMAEPALQAPSGRIMLKQALDRVRAQFAAEVDPLAWKFVSGEATAEEKRRFRKICPNADPKGGYKDFGKLEVTDHE